MAGKLIFVNVPSQNLENGQKFYNTLLGADFAPTLSEQYRAVQQPISADGIDLVLAEPFNNMDRVTCYYAVDDLGQTLDQLRQDGAKVLADPFPLAPPQAVVQDPDYQQAAKKHGGGPSDGGATGQCAIVQDPNGNAVGVVQLAEPAQAYFKFGKHRNELTQDQVEAQKVAKNLGKKLPHH